MKLNSLRYISVCHLFAMVVLMGCNGTTHDTSHASQPKNDSPKTNTQRSASKDQAVQAPNTLSEADFPPDIHSYAELEKWITNKELSRVEKDNYYFAFAKIKRAHNALELTKLLGEHKITATSGDEIERIRQALDDWSESLENVLELGGGNSYTNYAVINEFYLEDILHMYRDGKVMNSTDRIRQRISWNEVNNLVTEMCKDGYDHGKSTDKYVIENTGATGMPQVVATCTKCLDQTEMLSLVLKGLPSGVAEQTTKQARVLLREFGYDTSQSESDTAKTKTPSQNPSLPTSPVKSDVGFLGTWAVKNGARWTFREKDQALIVHLRESQGGPLVTVATFHWKAENSKIVIDPPLDQGSSQPRSRLEWSISANGQILTLIGYDAEGTPDQPLTLMRSEPLDLPSGSPIARHWNGPRSFIELLSNGTGVVEDGGYSKNVTWSLDETNHTINLTFKGNMRVNGGGSYFPNPQRWRYPYKITPQGTQTVLQLWPLKGNPKDIELLLTMGQPTAGDFIFRSNK